MTLEQAREVILDPLFYGALMVREGQADGMVAGAEHATADVLRAAFQCIGTAPGCSIVSSCFVMLVPNCSLGEGGMMSSPTARSTRTRMPASWRHSDL